MLGRYGQTPKKLTKLMLNGLQTAQVLVGQITGRIDFPVPPNSSMRKTSSTTIRHYYESGIRTYLPIAAIALHEGVDLNAGIRILDFGCGVGRQLLHFTRYFPAPAYFACDVDHTSVAFIRVNYPHVEAYTNEYDPPLKYPDGYFDMVYSVSIFSHLSMPDQVLWLN
jgi:SAM-dependent methyltransferase